MHMKCSKLAEAVSPACNHAPLEDLNCCTCLRMSRSVPWGSSRLQGASVEEWCCQLTRSVFYLQCDDLA